MTRCRWGAAAAVLVVGGWAGGAAWAQEEPGQKKPDFPPFKEVSDGFDKVVTTADGEPSFYGIWLRKKDGQLLAELPRGFANQKHFIATTVAAGERFAGLQGRDWYVYWRRYDKRLALVEPNLGVRSTGDQESKASVKNIFTDTVLLDVPIVCMGPDGGPVIDLDELLLGQSSKFFDRSAAGLNAKLASVESVKAFPQNIEVSIQAPTGDGQYKTFHYSISLIPENPAYKSRAADERIGFFTTNFVDLGKTSNQEKFIRYVNRWHLEKRDPSLKKSPPKDPIVFYIDTNVPVRYRRWVRDGVLAWNKAFEKCGIVDAIEVYYQDATTGAHMDKDPEDVRYNFVRWLSNDISTAIGPSRANPMTGEILDADIVLTDGWIRVFWYEYKEYLPQTAMEGFSPETYAWLERKPRWDPRIRLAAPGERDLILAQRAARGVLKYGGHPAFVVDPAHMDEEAAALAGRASLTSGLCMAARGKAYDASAMRLHMELAGLLGDDKPKDDKPKGDKDEDESLLDGVPEWYIGPALKDLTMHEVGHTLGLRHNFKASSVYTMEQMNTEEFKGRKTIVTSVMDYTPVNINMGDGPIQGDYQPIDIGAYDLWAIEYGYTFENDLKPILGRVAEPELVYQTDEDTIGPDPLARRYDMAKDPLNFAKSRMKLAKQARERIIEKFVKDGDSWSNARRGYQITLGIQTQALSMMSRWVGGSYVHRDRKGDPNARLPVVPVEPEKQREALKWVIENSFHDESFGLTPDLLARMTVDKWFDGGGQPDEDATWPIHDRIMGVQASVLTQLMNPTRLKRVNDQELAVPGTTDTVTLPELLDTISAAVWTELDNVPDKRFTAREPMVSGLRRNLQREHMERLIDLMLDTESFNAASKPIAQLAASNLRQIEGKVESVSKKADSNLDPYTRAHLDEVKIRIAKALEAQYLYNVPQAGAPAMFFPFFQAPPAEQPKPGDEGDR